jgi:hypothetical protein
MHLRRTMLLRHLRLPRQRWHLRAVPRSHLRCRSAMLRWSRLHEWLLRRLPRPRDVVHELQPMLLQQLHERCLSIGAGRPMRPRRRLPRVLLGPELHECVRQQGLYRVRPHLAGGRRWIRCPRRSTEGIRSARQLELRKVGGRPRRAADSLHVHRPSAVTRPASSVSMTVPMPCTRRRCHLWRTARGDIRFG